MSTVLLPMKRVDEPPAFAAADDDCLPLRAAWLAAALLPVAVGVPARPDAPGWEELPRLVDTTPLAALDDAPAGFDDMVVPTITTEPATTTAAAAASAVRHRGREGAGDMSVLSFGR